MRTVRFHPPNDGVRVDDFICDGTPLRMLGISVPIYTNIHFPFTSLPLLMAPYVSSSNPTGGRRPWGHSAPGRLVPHRLQRLRGFLAIKGLGPWGLTSEERAQGRRVHLIFHAVGSAVMVWVDGQRLRKADQAPEPLEVRGLLARLHDGGRVRHHRCAAAPGQRPWRTGRRPAARFGVGGLAGRFTVGPRGMAHGPGCVGPGSWRPWRSRGLGGHGAHVL